MKDEDFGCVSEPSEALTLRRGRISQEIVPVATLRNRLENINALLRRVEVDLVEQGKQGVVAAHEIRLEVTESSEAVERAIEALDANYRDMS